ncbi:hypothetical protein C8T65DRAFT_743796 [Cerioporus squamosus]|nr:hypothetical protein C8T65DRAFT_743796 [Cerioporus squamosus]
MLNHSTPLNELYPWGFALGVIVPPVSSEEQDQEENEILQPVAFHRRRRAYFDRTPALVPSSEVRPFEFSTSQKDEDHRTYCGRPYQRSTPPSLLDETLCQLRHNIQAITPTPTDIQCFESLRTSAARNVPDEQHRGSIVPQRADQGFIGDTGYYNDGDLRAACLDATLSYYVQVIKDAAAQLNFPAVLVLHFGPYLVIAATVYGNEPNVEHLCCIPLHAHATNDAELAAGERVLGALRVALLRERCPTLPICQRGLRTDFPSAAATPNRTGPVTTSRISQPLTTRGSSVFSTRPERVSHAAGFAPALIAMDPVYDWIMVVMEDKTEEYSNTLKKRAAEKEQAAKLPAVSLEKAQDEVMAKLALLHNKNFVHGDLRDVNVIVRNEGVEGEVTYPRGINTELARPVDALAGEQIKAEHDVWMAERLLD